MTLYDWAEKIWEECGKPEAALQVIAKGVIAAQQEARAERDQEWRAAFNRLSDECDLGCATTATTNCQYAVSLRALLEGK